MFTPSIAWLGRGFNASISATSTHPAWGDLQKLANLYEEDFNPEDTEKDQRES
jgi:hypothetical protein